MCAIMGTKSGPLDFDSDNENKIQEYIKQRITHLLEDEDDRIKLIKILLQENSVDINSTDNDGDTAIMIAAARGMLDVMKCLLERHDIKPEKPNNDGTTITGCEQI